MYQHSLTHQDHITKKLRLKEEEQRRVVAALNASGQALKADQALAAVIANEQQELNKAFQLLLEKHALDIKERTARQAENLEATQSALRKAEENRVQRQEQVAHAQQAIKQNKIQLVELQG